MTLSCMITLKLRLLSVFQIRILEEEVADGKTTIEKNEADHHKQLTLKDEKIEELKNKVRKTFSSILSSLIFPRALFNEDVVF